MTSGRRPYTTISDMFPVPVLPASEWLCSHGILSWKFPASLGSYTLLGRSRAADATSLLIPELEMLLDCGCLVSSVRPTHIFITHAHSDHCLDITRLVSRSRPPQVYLPTSNVQPMREFLQTRMILCSGEPMHPDPNQWSKNHELIGVEPDDVLPFRKNMQVRVFEMDHSVPCCGYGFYEMRQKLKKEYEHLSTKEIANLRKENKSIELSEERIVPLFAFLGDTTATVFEKYATEMSQFRLIIVECSFIDYEQHAERACDVKHVIWDDLRPFVVQHPDIIFILIHFSQQYKSETIKEFFRKLNLPNVVPFI